MELSPNATTLERIIYYVETDQDDKARALSQLADHLEECFSWEIDFN